MTEIKKFIEIVTKACTISEPTTNRNGGRGSGVIVYNPDGTIKELNISSSLINKFFHKGNKREFCPRYLYITAITKEFKIPPTESMQKGLYLESGLLGKTADGAPLTDLPRHTKTGAKLTDHKRIDQQIAMWDMRKKQYGIIVQNEGDNQNVQVRQKIAWESKEYPDLKIWMYGTADLISPFKDNGIEYEMAIQDVKGCGNLNSTFGEYSWGDVTYMDHFQLILYSRIFDIPYVLYLVFDWSKDLNFKAIPINVNPKHKDPNKANEARMRIRDMEETVRLFIIEMMSQEASGWQPVQNKKCANDCPNYNCEYYQKNSEI